MKERGASTVRIFSRVLDQRHWKQLFARPKAQR